MEFIFFYLLRRFFVKLSFSPNEIFVSKGLLIRRVTTLPISAVTMIDVRRTLLMRIFKAKLVTLHTLSGNVSFYLHRDEPLPFCNAAKDHEIRPQGRSIVFGAFIDTRALSGVVIFAIAMLRLGQLPGGYYQKLLSALLVTAEEMSKILQLFDVTIPRITAFIAVFVIAAWLFALARKLLRLYKFKVYLSPKYVTVKHGLVTLYERTLVRNNLVPVVCCDTLSTLVTGAAPLYCHRAMLFPPTDHDTRQRLLHSLCGIDPTKEKTVKPPPKALFGHCCAPLGWLAASAGAAIILWIGEYYGVFGYTAMLRSILWTGAAVSLWYTLTYGIYMLHSFVSTGDITRLTHRSGARLYTVYIPLKMRACCVIRTNPFQRRGRMCDVVITAADTRRLKLRNLEIDRIKRIM